MDYVLLRRQNYSVPETELFYKPSADEWESIREDFDGRDRPISWDFETEGLSVHLHDAVCVGISDGIRHVSIYFYNDIQRADICHWLNTKRLIGYNALFDGLFNAKYTGQVPWIYRDAMVQFKGLANEGWTGQNWSLKTAMVDILGWPEANDHELRAYMKEHRCQMHEVPWPILGRYNALDAAATYQAYEYFESFTSQFPGLVDYWETEFSNLIALTTEQHYNGMAVDIEHYLKVDVELDRQQEEYLNQFKALVGDHIAAYDAAVVAAIENSPPAKQVTRDGKPTAAYARWLARIEEAKAVSHFNVDSTQDLCWLFYEGLKYPVAKRTASGKPAIDKAVIGKLGEAGQLLQKYRKKRDVQKFVKSLLADAIDGKISPDVRIHGTISGRVSSGKEI